MKILESLSFDSGLSRVTNLLAMGFIRKALEGDNSSY